MQDIIKKTRVKIDGLAQLVAKLPISDEVRSTYDSLILGKAWLGKVLGELGTESPYPKDGTRHSVEDIEKTADTSALGIEEKVIYGSNNKVLVDAVLTQEDWNMKNHIEKVDYLREAISKICKEILPMNPSGTWEKKFLYEQWAHKHLSEARFWLGFELQRIKENK